MNPTPIDSSTQPHRLLVGMAACATIGAALLLSLPTASAAAGAAVPASTAPASTTPTSKTAASMPPPEDPQVMLKKLEEQVKQQPNDLNSWQLLARAYVALNRPNDAVEAYRRILALTPGDAQAHVELARTIGNANGRKLNAEAESLLNKALAIDANNVLAHSLLGKSALERGQTAVAKKHWEKALANLDPQHPFALQLRNAIQIADRPTAPPPNSNSH